MEFTSKPFLILFHLCFYVHLSLPKPIMNVDLSMDRLFEILRIDDKDGSKVKWAHGVNSAEELQHYLLTSAVHLALNQNESASTSQNGLHVNSTRPMMIESDVIFDDVIGQPVMAHPPKTGSDLTFRDWLERLVDRPDLGAKADFKTMDSVVKGMPIFADVLKNKKNSFAVKDTVMTWLNADICKGPMDSQEPIIDGRRFLDLCRSYAVSGYVLSLGWTTPLLLPDEVNVGYTDREFDSMKKLVGTLPNETLITYPVRAKLMTWTDVENFNATLMQGDRFSLTVWTSVLDELEDRDFEALAQLSQKFGNNRVFFDLPSEEMTQLNKFLLIV